MATDGTVHRWNSTDIKYKADQERRLFSPLYAPGGSGDFSMMTGRRVNGGGLQVAVSGSPEQVTVSPGAGVLSAAGVGYAFEVPTAVPLSLPARPGAGQTRSDLIVARLYDPDIGLGGVRELKIERLSASQPVPDGCLVLATLTVPSSGSISVTPSDGRTVAAGGVLPVATTARRDALAAYAGMTVWNSQVSRLQVYTGTAWVSIAPEQTVIDWTDLTASSGWTANSGNNRPQVRLDGNTVTYRGGLYGGAANTTATVVPSWATPTRTAQKWAWDGSAASRVVINPAGEIKSPGTIGAENQIPWNRA